MSKARFSSIRHPYFHKLKRMKFSFLICIVIVFIFLFWTSHVDQYNIDKQYESLDRALQHNIVHCYAVEGTYPPNLQYMIDHYGLIYDHKLFYVDYQPIGSNIYPNYQIICLYDSNH